MVGHLKQSLKKLSTLWISLGLSLSFGLIFWLRWRIAATQPLWLDEIFSFKFAQLTWYDLITQTGYYVDFAHPSGFYLLTKFWLLGGSSELWLRLPALLLALGSAWLLYRIMDSLKADWGKWLILLYFAGHWLMVQLGAELRMYQVVVLIMLLVLVKLFHHWQHELPLTVRDELQVIGWLTVGLYLDYAMLWLLFVLCGVWVVAWWRRSYSMFWLGEVLGGVALLTSPQLWILITHFDALQRLNLHLYGVDWLTATQSLHSLTGLPFGLGFGVMSMLGVAVFLLRWYREQSVKASEQFLIPLSLASMIVLPIVTVLLFALFGQSLIQPRNLTVVSLACMLSLSLAADTLLQRLQLPLNKVTLMVIAVVVLGWNCVTPKVTLSNNWFWIRTTVVQGFALVFVGQREYLMEPFFIYYSQQPTPVAFEYFSFLTAAEFNTQPPKAAKILVVYEEPEQMGAKILTKNDFPICSTVQCEVMGVR